MDDFWMMGGLFVQFVWPQYSGLFYNVTTHHTPAYDFAPNPDKQWILRHTEKMLPIHR